jgi:phosphoribosylaminoimidazolecarboxamide formyltransferase/IMP cyclohydrolase
MNKVKTALISLSDKDGIIPFARFLSENGVLILSTGGTAKILKENGVKVRDVSNHTGFPEIMDGRVKTLHPKIHGGLLALRDNEKHMGTLKEHDIQPIDMVIVNLYPFEKTVADEDVLFEDAIENIDIGGPSMLRAAAKNFKDVTVITDPEDYPVIEKELDDNDFSVSYETNKKLAVKVFQRTFEYDKAIYTYLAGSE